MNSIFQISNFKLLQISNCKIIFWKGRFEIWNELSIANFKFDFEMILKWLAICNLAKLQEVIDIKNEISKKKVVAMKVWYQNSHPCCSHFKYLDRGELWIQLKDFSTILRQIIWMIIRLGCSSVYNGLFLVN